jgi:hypothetical protein
MSVAAKAISIATPCRLSIPTQATSNVPRPSGIAPRVAAIDAIMKLTRTIHIAGLSPKARGKQDRIMQKTGGRFRDRLQQEGGTGQPPDPACRVTSASPSYSPIRSSQAAA